MSTQHIKMGGAPEGYDAQLVLRELHAHGEPVVHIARDDKRMSAMAEALAFFAPDVPVIKFPAWDCLPYDRVSPMRMSRRRGWQHWPHWSMTCPKALFC